MLKHTANDCIVLLCLIALLIPVISSISLCVLFEVVTRLMPCFVFVEFPTGYPRILLHPKLKSVEKGLSTVMQCEASGDPEPSIMWLKDMMPVDLSDPRIQLLDNGEDQEELI